MKRGFAETRQAGKLAAALGYPELEPVAEEVGVAASTQDNSITVIENPSLNGLLGILLSRHFDRQPLDKYLIDVRHIRVDDRDDIKEQRDHKRVRISMGVKYRGAEEIIYRHVSTEDEQRLPAPSLLPYRTCFLHADEFDYLFSGLERDNKAAIRTMYRLLAINDPLFSFRRGKLVLPDGYANLRLD